MSDEKLTMEELSHGDYEKEDYKIKIIVVGDSGIGKTNLVNRFTSNKYYTNSKSTIVVEFVYKTLKMNKDVIKVEVWNTSWRERYRAITSSYHKGARDGAIIVYDITSEESFKNVENWINDVSKKGNKYVKFLLLGNKKDLINDRVAHHHFFPPRNQHHQKYHQLLLLLLRSILIWLLNSPLKRKI